MQREAERATKQPKLESRDGVMSAIAQPIPPDLVAPEARARTAGAASLTLAQGINAALTEALERHSEALIFGEDVAKKGGVYGVTRGLLAKGGPACGRSGRPAAMVC